MHRPDADDADVAAAKGEGETVPFARNASERPVANLAIVEALVLFYN